MSQKDNSMLVTPEGVLTFNGKDYKCALGKAGVSAKKKEGDGATPVGCFQIQEVFYRKDRLGELSFPFPTHVTDRNDAWCDDAEDEHYNTHIKFEDGNQTEGLWREDDVYNVVAVLGYNNNPPVPGKGSAIFMHIAREGYTPTEGCIALSLEDLLAILTTAVSDVQVCVTK